MTAAYDYENLHHLVDRLTPDQARRLQLLVTQDEELSQVASALPGSGATDDEAAWASFLALFGSIDDGPTDMAERHDDYIRDRMRQRFGDLA